MQKFLFIFNKGGSIMFWEKFVDLCNEQNMSPNKVAEILHISSGSVTGWKKGAFPRSTTIKKIAKYFGVTDEYFLDVDYDEINHARNFAKEKCKNENIIIPELEEKLDINYATFQSWCNGISDSLNAKLHEVANFFEVSFEELIGRSEPKNLIDDQLSGLDFALYGETKDLTEEEKEKILEFIKFTKSQRD
jgi:transcriptional regulator, XRE family